MQIELDNLRIDLWPVGIGIVSILLVIRWRKIHSFAHLICFMVFNIYVLFAIDKAFFPIAISGYYADAMREVRSFQPFVNLIPLNFNLSEMPNLVLRQIFQNILLTVPFGFGISFVARVSAKNFRWLIPVIGLGIEATQLGISLLLGYLYRVIDINDVLLNSMGVLVGYGLFRMFARLYTWVARYLGILRSGFAGYFHEVAQRATH